jgi:cellulose biosynthesis protein BcsQ
MSESDVVLFPIQPSSIEVRSAIVTVKAAKMISEQYNPDMICRFVANRVWPGKSSLTQELLDACAKYFPQVPLCDTMIYERHAYRQAITNGRSLSEFRRSPAASEIADLLAEVIRIYGLSQKAKLITASN